MASSYRSPAPVVRRVRGYFAAVNRTGGMGGGSLPAVFDPAQMGGFSLDAPPAPWVSLGWLKNFARVAASKTAEVMTGIPAAALEQTRATLEAEVRCEFLSWTKLTMALATGSQHMNVLAPAAGAAASGDGATAAPAVAIGAGATATMLPMTAAAAAAFGAGQIVAVDVDYLGQTGFVGSPVSGAYVRTPLTDVDYVRRVTTNVALVAAVSTAGSGPGLTLAEPLPGGAPMTVSGPGAMKAQAAIGFVDREGGSFFQEWSGLFVMEGSQGERIFFYYPRLQPLEGAAEAGEPLDAKRGSTLQRVTLKGAWRALPVVDALDGERVVCYRSLLPPGAALV